MDINKLVNMANRIGTFFESYTDEAEALNEIASHLKNFWAPRMRDQLLSHIDAGGEGLKDIVLRSVRTHRARLLHADKQAAAPAAERGAPRVSA